MSSIEEQRFTEAQAVALGVVEEILKLSMIDWRIAVAGDAEKMDCRLFSSTERNIVAEW